MKIKKLFFLLVISSLFAVGVKAQEITIGNGSTVSEHLPIDGWYSYSYSQVIYYQSEINQCGKIKKIRWEFNGHDISHSNEWTVYLGHTTKTQFDSATDWIDINNMTQVYSGSVNLTVNGNDKFIEVDINDFQYNNTDNLVIAVDENNPGYDTAAEQGLCSLSAGLNRGLEFHNDNINPDPSNPPTKNTSLHTYFANITLIMDNDVSDLDANMISDSQANLFWDSSLYNWKLKWGTQGFDVNTQGTEIDIPTWPRYTLKGLTPNTTYDYYVRGECLAGNGYGPWVGPYTFTTCSKKTPDYLEEFNSFPVDCWLEGDDGDPTTGPNKYNYTNCHWGSGDFANTGTSNAARFTFAHANDKDRLFSPSFDLSSGGPYQINVDVAVTKYNSTDSATMDSDDQVLLLQSTDGGTTWSTLYTWNKDFSPSNAGNNITVDLSGINSDNIKFAFWADEGTVDSTPDYEFFVDNFKVRSVPAGACSKTTSIWNGSNWNQGIPVNGTPVIISGDYDTAHRSLEVCSVTVDPGKTLTASKDSYISIENDVINNGTIIVNNTASFVQVNNNSSISGNGTFTVNIVTNPLSHYYDYVYLSSPINSTSLSMGDIVPNAWRYYDYDPNYQPNATYPFWHFLDASAVAERGRGYAISAPSSQSANTPLNVSFSKNSDPFNNGDVTYSLLLGPDQSGGGDDDYNLVGNPYPSAIDFNEVVRDNSNIEGFYTAWTNCAGLDGNAHQESGYTTYTVGNGGSNGTSVSPCNNGSPTAGRYIAMGQGFMIDASNTGNLVFKNSHRVLRRNDNFINKSVTQDRMWLNMTTSNKAFSQIAVGFYPKATNQHDRLFDAYLVDEDMDAIYTINGNDKYTIQGLSEIGKNDRIVPLGIKLNSSSTVTFHIYNIEGKLKDINVLLHDMKQNVYYDIKNTDYTVKMPAGEYNNRFELIFTRDTGSVNSIINTKSVVLTQDDNNFILNSAETIKSVKVYDLTGRLILNNAVNANKSRINLKQVSAGNLLIFKVLLQNGDLSIIKTIKK